MKSLGKRHVLKQKVIRESSTWWQSWKLCPFFFLKKKKRLFIWAIFTLFFTLFTHFYTLHFTFIEFVLHFTFIEFVKMGHFYTLYTFLHFTFIEFVTILLLFYVLVFGQKACGILVPQPAVEPAPPALEGKS